MTAADDQAVFGFPDFWQTVYDKHRQFADQAIRVSQLANDMFSAAEKEPMKDLKFVVYLLVRMAATGWTELVILAGNGAGLGAMKISRGMFEAAVMAEYLRRTPTEIDDYLEFGHVLRWKRMKSYPETLSPKQSKKIQKEYDRVKIRFADRKGRVRAQWNRHSIAYMAQKVGREEQYEMAYGIAASMHHGNFEAMISHLKHEKARLYMDQPPSMNWIPEALVSGHAYLLQALDTLNECFEVGFDDRLKAASDAFQVVWSKKHP